MQIKYQFNQSQWMNDSLINQFITFYSCLSVAKKKKKVASGCWYQKADKGFSDSSHPSSDFTAEGTRQLQHKVNCSLVPGWVPVCPFFSIFTLCYPSRQCRELMIFHSEGESIQSPHYYNIVMQMLDCVYTSRPYCKHATYTVICSCTYTGSVWWALIAHVV